MAKLVFSLQQSLDGYVDHMKLGPPEPVLARHFTEETRGQSGFVLGRVMYEIMRYWDEDQTDWDAADREFAALWRSKTKWVVSRTLQSVGPNATLIEGDAEAAIRGLKARIDGEIAIGGPALAGSLCGLGLIDEYRLCFRPVVLGGGTPSSPARGRRCALCPAIALARRRSE